MYEVRLDPEIMKSARMISEKMSEMKFSKQLEELSQKAEECTRAITEYIQATVPQLQSFMEQFDHTIQMIQDAIPNIRYIQENLSREMPEFSKSITSMMQTLDFPAVQPEITREQLKDRLENMSHTELETVKTSAVAAANSVPKKEVQRPFVKKMLSIAFAVITVVIPAIEATLSIADHFTGSKDGINISVDGNGNHVIVNVYNGSTPKIDYYFEDKQASKEAEEDTLKEQSSPVAIATPNTKCDNN